MDQEEPMDYTVVEENKKSRNKSCLQYRGLAIIAIFEKFHRQLKVNDLNFEPDKKLLVEAFKKLQYEVKVWDDIMESETFFQRLQLVSKDPLHRECETFALVILSHGGENGIIYAYEKDFSRQKVIDIFNAENCTALKNKLKLFIFQACCGNKPGEFASGSPEAVPPIVKLEKYVEKDNLILCSTREGFMHTRLIIGKLRYHLQALA
ncbi:hypothetical protein J437_LFUL003920 [Ladona fulva]|uniref:Caspase family p20 domain-containing protein n=1 Tax=Ladona fulva TaxID=123851 RepID=A0A8K0P2T9_LADFU|nr:hypothetical protein J437_LFUL003920 [Ladona fulva]